MKTTTKSKLSNSNQQFGTNIGVDLGDTKHAVCVTDKDGVILEEFSLINCRDKLKSLAERFPKATVAMEVGTHSPWISRLLTAEGMKVIVANARKLRAIYQNERKCDKLDARMLAKLVRVDPELLSPIEHGSEQAQKDIMVIKLRDTLVRQRTHIIGSIRGIIKSVGLRVGACGTCSFHVKAREFCQQHPELESALAPSLDALESLTKQIKTYERRIERTAKEYFPEALHLQQIPSIGPITSLAFVLSIGDPNRFKDPRDVGAWLGLVPRRDQSGDTDRQLPITKAGNCYLRQLLVQCAQYLLGHWGPDCALRRQGLKLAARGGKAAKKKAVIAVARKLAVLMVAMWKSGRDYEAFPGSPEKFPGNNDGGPSAAQTAIPENRAKCEAQMAAC